MIDPFNDLPDGGKYTLDGLSITALLGALAQMLPHVATLLTVIWMALRIYEMPTVQRWLGREAPPRDRDGD